MGLSYDGKDVRPLDPYPQSKELLVNIVDGLARKKPNAAYSYYPKSPKGYQEGFRKLTFRQFANAVNALAWWMTIQFGDGLSFDTMAYIGPNDFRHNALILACSKAGYNLLLASPRNQHEACKSLLTEVKCKAILAADPRSASATAILKAYPAPILEVPSLDTLLNHTFPPYPYNKSYDDAKDEPLITLHSSGTTGVPKPIVYSNAWITAYMQTLQVQPTQGTETKDQRLRGNRMFLMMPPFHAAYIFLALCTPFSNDTILVLPPADAVTSAQVFIEGLKHIQIDVAAVPPTFISHIALNEDYLDIVQQSLEGLITGGGKPNDQHGGIVASRVDLFTVYGATEVGIIADLIPQKFTRASTWDYIQPHPCNGWEFREQKDSKGIYEAWVVRNPDERLEQPVFKLFPHIKEYFTRDLFQPHADQPNLWKWCGRIDDTIVLSSGANVSPIAMECGLSKHSLVEGVMMVGTGWTRPVLILQLRKPVRAVEDVREEIWNEVQSLNSHYFEDHRILKSFVLFAEDDKAMVRTSKGTIQRRATVELYRQDIEGLFGRPR